MSTKTISISVFCIVALVTALTFLLQWTAGPAYVDKMKRLAHFLWDKEPTFSTWDAEALVGELVPLVEEATGRQFADIPEIRLASRDDLAKVLVRNGSSKSRQVTRVAHGKQGATIGEAKAKRIAHALLAFYSFPDRILYLVPQNVFPMFKLLKIDKRQTLSMIKLIIAHELTHVLQDQDLDLGKRYSGATGNEELDALNATMEGHAVFVQGLVGKQLGLDDAVLEFSRLLSAGLMTFEEPTLQMLEKVATRRFEFIYLGGKNFIEHHYTKSGNEGVWEILANPPKDTNMIAEPETYSPRQMTSFQYAEVLDGLDTYLGQGPFSLRNYEISKAKLHGSYANMDPRKRNSIISRIEHVQAFRVKRTASHGHLTIVFSVLKDSKCGAELISAIEEMVDNNIEKMRSSSTYEVKHFSTEDFTGIEADASRKVSIAFSHQGEEQSLTDQSFRIWRGKTFLEINDTDFGATGNQIVQIANEVFSRYGEMVDQA